MLLDESIAIFTLVSISILGHSANAVVTTLPGIAVGLEDGTIPDSSFNASSEFNPDRGAQQPKYSRLNIDYDPSIPRYPGWSAATKSATEWIQVDLGTTSRVSGIATQGRGPDFGSHHQWVRSYRLSCSNNSVDFVDVEDPANPGNAMIFTGNTNRQTIVYHTFDEVQLCQYVRLHVVTWHNHPSLRWEIYREPSMNCCDLQSSTTNVFDTYNVTVAPWASTDYTLNYSPAEYSPGMKLPPGTTSMSVTAVSSSSPATVIGTCNYTVTIDISLFPVQCPPSVYQEQTDLGNGTFTITPSRPQVSGYDYRPFNQVVNVVSSSTPGIVGTSFPVGTHTSVTIEYSDAYLKKECSFRLEVTDPEPPKITCPENILSTTTNYITYSPVSYSDNDGVAVSGPVSTPSALMSGSQFPLGNSTVILTIADNSGNTANCSFTVNVALRELPIACPPTRDLTVETERGLPYYTYQDQPAFNITYPAESMTYIPYGPLMRTKTYGSMNLTRLLYSSTPHEVTVEVTDGMLSKICIEDRIIVADREPPTIVCPNHLCQNTRWVDFSLLPLKVNVDNSGESSHGALSPPIARRGTFPRGNTTYTYTVTDGSGNIATCSFNVTIITASRDLTPIIIGCSVGGAVLLLIVLILMIACCMRPGTTCLCGCAPKKTSKKSSSKKANGKSLNGKSSSTSYTNNAYEVGP